MKNATINLGRNEFGQTEGGLVYGGLHVQIEDVRFPDARWTDFVVVVLAWWCRALARVLEGEKGPVKVRFMEGPYLVNVGPMAEDSIRLELVEAGLKPYIRYDGDVSSSHLIESLLSAAVSTLSECKAHSWWSSDADELAEAMSTLRRKSGRTVN